MKVGVLGLQGDVREHERALSDAGATPVVVKSKEALEGIDAVVIPGGESTTISKLMERAGLTDPLRRRLADGMPAYGTCAGLILLARVVENYKHVPATLAALDIAVRRNAYGRQLASFETDIAVEGLDEPFTAVFIRAPVISSVGPGVKVLASVDGDPVLVRQEKILGSTFHPEMTRDDRIHRSFVEMI